VHSAPGGDGKNAADALYGGESVSRLDERSSVRVHSAPGGDGKNAADALYGGESVSRLDERSSVRVHSAPRGDGKNAADALYGGESVSRLDERSSVRVHSAPGSDGKNASNFLYDVESCEDRYCSVQRDDFTIIHSDSGILGKKEFISTELWQPYLSLSANVGLPDRRSKRIDQDKEVVLNRVC
jgi:hypothetical protein